MISSTNKSPRDREPPQSAGGTLLWVTDSCASRIVKWQMLEFAYPHLDRILAWEDLTEDAVLLATNPKRQVPCWLNGTTCISDSLLITASLLAPLGWAASRDALRFRCADVEISQALQLLYSVRKYTEGAQLRLVLKLACDAIGRVCAGLEELVLKPGAPSPDEQVEPGWIALHVTAGFLHHYAMAEGRESVFERLWPLREALLPCESRASFTELERCLAPHAPLVPARWCTPR